MFIKKSMSSDVFSSMEESLNKSKTPSSDKHFLNAVKKLEKAIGIFDKVNLSAEADLFCLFLQKFASTREYSECIIKSASIPSETAQSNAIFNKNDELNADSVLEVELDDDLDLALKRIESEK